MTKKQAVTGKGTTKGKRYSDEFVAQALATWDKGRAEGKTAKVIAAEIGVHPTMLPYWRARTGGKPAGALAKARLERKAQRAKAKLKLKLNGHATTTKAAWQDDLTTEVVKLRRELASLREENELLTKMVRLVAKREG